MKYDHKYQPQIINHKPKQLYESLPLCVTHQRLKQC